MNPATGTAITDRNEELPRSKASRRGYRAHITKTYSRITEITSSTEPITTEQRISLTTALEQLREKQTLLKELDTRIVNGITEEGELEQEICNTEDYHTTVTEKIAYVREFLHQGHAIVSPASPPSPPLVLPLSQSHRPHQVHPALSESQRMLVKQILREQ